MGHDTTQETAQVTPDDRGVRTAAEAAALAAAEFPQYRRLLEMWARQLASVATRRLRYFVAPKELWGVVYDHYLHVCRYWQPERGKFTTLWYASNPWRLAAKYCAQEAMDFDLGAAQQSRPPEERRRVYSGGRANSAELHRAAADDPPQGDEMELREWIRATLKPREYELFRRVYLEGDRAATVAAERGVTHQAVNEALKRSLLRLIQAKKPGFADFRRDLSEALVRRTLKYDAARNRTEADVRRDLQLQRSI